MRFPANLLALLVLLAATPPHPHAAAAALPAALLHAACAASALLGLRPAPDPAASALTAGVSGTAIVEQVHEKGLWVARLARLTDAPPPAVTRLVFTPRDVEAREYVRGLMLDAGLEVTEDGLGNMRGLWRGLRPSLGTVSSGSHTDAIPLAGAYDGVLGVVGAVAAIRSLKQAGFLPVRSIEAWAFTSEEPTRFGLSCVGSRGAAGVLSAATLDGLVDANGTSFMDAAAAAGYGFAGRGVRGSLPRAPRTSDLLLSARLAPGEVTHFVELHIEQGAELQRLGAPVAAVTAIAAPAALAVTFSGDGGHAGSLLMADRADAGLAAAEFMLAVEAAALGSGSPDTVATTGDVALAPGAANSVPRTAAVSVDVRDVEGSRRDQVLSAIKAAARRIAKARGVRLEMKTISADPPVTCDPEILAAARAAAASLRLPAIDLVSRAYHDTLFMAGMARAGMIFVRCRNGWSHRPDEYASPSDIEAGVKTLALTLAELAMDGSTEEGAGLVERACPITGAKAEGGKGCPFAGVARRAPAVLGGS